MSSAVSCEVARGPGVWVIPMGPDLLGYDPLSGLAPPRAASQVPDAFVAAGCNTPQKQMWYFQTTEGPVRRSPCRKPMLSKMGLLKSVLGTPNIWYIALFCSPFWWAVHAPSHDMGGFCTAHRPMDRVRCKLRRKELHRPPCCCAYCRGLQTRCGWFGGTTGGGGGGFAFLKPSSRIRLQHGWIWIRKTGTHLRPRARRPANVDGGNNKKLPSQ
jgi:hypothetical protein